MSDQVNVFLFRVPTDAETALIKLHLFMLQKVALGFRDSIRTWVLDNWELIRQAVGDSGSTTRVCGAVFPSYTIQVFLLALK